MFRVWSASITKEIAASVTYEWGSAVYASDGFAKLSGLNAISEPSIPLLLYPPHSSSSVFLNLTLAWHASSRALSYHVQISTESSFSTVVKEDSLLTDTANAPNGLEGGVAYYWRVRAKNSGGVSGWSEIWSFTTAIPVPSQVSLLSPLHATTMSNDSVLFCWSKESPEVDTYSLEISKDSMFSTVLLIDTVITDTMKIVSKCFTNKTSYWWRVKAHNVSGWGSFSEPRKLNIDIPPTKIIVNDFSLQGNDKSPSRFLICYRLISRSKVSLKLLSLQGRLIQTFVHSFQNVGTHQVPLDFSCLSKGCYVIYFKAGAASMKRKISVAQ